MQNTLERFFKAAMNGSTEIRFIPRYDTAPLDIKALEGASGNFTEFKLTLLDEGGIERTFTPQEWENFLGIDTEPTEEPLREDHSDETAPSPTGNLSEVMRSLRSLVLAEKICIREDEGSEENAVRLVWQYDDGTYSTIRASEFLEISR